MTFPYIHRYTIDTDVEVLDKWISTMVPTSDFTWAYFDGMPSLGVSFRYEEDSIAFRIRFGI